MSNAKHSPIIFGILGSLALLTIYFGILTLVNSFSHAIEQFIGMWYWIITLVIGFGIQVGLYIYIKNKMSWNLSSSVILAASGGVSTTAMIACCAHHLTDVLPIIGLSAMAIFLEQYQKTFLTIGVISNLLGIAIMLRIIKKNNLIG